MILCTRKRNPFVSAALQEFPQPRRQAARKGSTNPVLQIRNWSLVTSNHLGIKNWSLVTNPALQIIVTCQKSLVLAKEPMESKGWLCHLAIRGNSTLAWIGLGRVLATSEASQMDPSATSFATKRFWMIGDHFVAMLIITSQKYLRVNVGELGWFWMRLVIISSTGSR